MKKKAIIQAMANPAGIQARLVRFGPFELDARSGELRKHGVKIKLREQPVQILLMLLRQPGEIVLRDEIRLRLWPNNTVVEFDHGINAAIQKLRDALGDSAAEPRYVETVARRGYRFIADAENVGELRPVSHYRILEKLGEGGMGVVYRAEDLKLGRVVAIKRLPVPSRELPESELRRFEREARAAAALNHPHICTVHGFEDVEGQPAIVMELVEGETLAQRLAKGPIPPAESRELAVQIAGALAEAHRRGVIHRDLKPANIMWTKSGAKVLDFGLAVAEGAFVGSVHYMSPEQAQGRDTDARSDIFSLGAVLYEMLTGHRAFPGDSTASVMAAILERDPPAAEPEELNRVVKSCLAKDPDDRFQSARDLKRAIEWAARPETSALVPAHTWKKWIPWVAAALFAVVALAVWLRPGAPAQQRIEFSIFPPSGAPLAPVRGHASFPEISPDGSSLLYSGQGGIYLRRFDSLDPVLVRGLQNPTDVPFWSFDSRTVAFRDQRGLVTIRLPDGAPKVIAQLSEPTRGAAWSTTGTILISKSGGLYTVPAAGGELKPLALPGVKAGRRVYPQFLAGGRDFLFLLDPDGGDGSEIYLATLNGQTALNAVMLMKNDTAAAYTPAGGGLVLFVRDNNLYSQSLDLRSRKLKGDAQMLQRGIVSIPGAAVDRAGFSVARNGAIAWRPGNALLNQATIFDRQGKEIGTAGPPTLSQTLVLSPDETRLLGGDWLFETDRPGRVNLGHGWKWGLWSADGSRLLGWRQSSGAMGERAVDGLAEVHLLGAATGELEDLSPDGKRILMRNQTRGISSVELTKTGLSRPALLGEPGETIWGCSLSPDGRRVVYASRGSGVYVQSFPGPGLRKQIADLGPTAFPVWRKDRKEIVIANIKGVWSVRVEGADAGLHFGKPELLFSVPRWPIGMVAAARPLAVSRDGSRIYLLQSTEQHDPGVINVTMGWANR